MATPKSLKKPAAQSTTSSKLSVVKAAARRIRRGQTVNNRAPTKVGTAHQVHPEVAAPELNFDLPAQLEFHYIKSSSFRMAFGGGVYGGLTPDGRYVSMFIFNERTPIPLQETCELKPTGQVGTRKGKVGRTGIIREIEIGVVLDGSTIEQMIPWLEKQLVHLKLMRERRAQGKASNDE